MLVLKSLVGLHRTIQLQLLLRYWLVHRLGLLDTEWFALERNRDHSVVFEIASKYRISDSLVDHDGYSISSKGFLPTVVDGDYSHEIKRCLLLGRKIMTNLLLLLLLLLSHFSRVRLCATP